MTLTIKDSLDLTGPGKLGTPSHSSENQGSENNAGESPRSNPVCLEVSVTIRSLPGENGDAPGSAGPVREEGRTVIVFDNGAVLRLSKNLPAGQKLIVSNPQGRDVVCRVMNGRNLPTVKGYIEIEFMEQVDDFWRIHHGAEPARVTETVKVSHPVPAPAVPGLTAQGHTPSTSIVPPVATPAALRVATREKESPSPSDNAPSFDDIVGVVRMSRTSPASAKSVAPTAPVSEVENGQSESEFVSTISTPNPINSTNSARNVTSVNRAIPSAQEFSSPPVSEPSPSNVFMAGGMFAAGQTSSASSPTGGHGRMPLVIGGLALLLAGFGGGYFYMHQGSAPAPEATATLAVQPSAPAPSAPPSDAKRVSMPEPAAESPSALPEATVASVSPAARISTATDAQQNLGRAARNADAKPPDRAPKQRQQIPGLKMKSPSAPRQNLTKLSEGSAPSITDVSSAVAVGGAPGAAMLAPVVRSENQPAPPPSLSPAGPSAKSIREPKLISSTHPTYPSVAKQAGTQGTVVITAQVDARGGVTDIKAVSGPAALRQAAIDAVRQWKYSPALIDGKPASAQVTVDVQFRLN